MRGPNPSQIRVVLVTQRMAHAISQIPEADRQSLKDLSDEEWLAVFEGQVPATIEEIQEARRRCGIAPETPNAPGR